MGASNNFEFLATQDDRFARLGALAERYFFDDAPAALIKLRQLAERAQAALELLPHEERAAYIKKKSHIWRSFKKYLRKMSYGKCWYSEANDPQSMFDVDHFRPKSEARRSETEFDDG